MGLLLLLSVSLIISIEATFAHSNNVIGADRHGIQENLRDLFNSIKENDVRKTETRRHFLEEEAARQQQVFDTMKEELRLMQQRHIYKRRSVHHGSGDADERAVTFKREIRESVTSTTAFPSSNCTLSDEEIWIQTYGTHQNDSGVWPLALSLKENEDMLKLFCIKAHEKLNNTVLKAVDAHVGFFPVMFQNRSITPVWADLIQYSEDRPRISTEVFSYLYMIKGNRPDCVFYIEEYEQHEDRLTDMVFAKHVCGIEGFEAFEIQPEKTKKKKGKKTPAKESPLEDN